MTGLPERSGGDRLPIEVLSLLNGTPWPCMDRTIQNRHPQLFFFYYDKVIIIGNFQNTRKG